MNSKKKKSKDKNRMNKDNIGKKSYFDIDPFLHEPNRLQIIAQLYSTDSLDMIFLKNTLHLTWGNLSSHVTKLEEKGYISVKKQFIGKKPYTILQITPFGKVQFENYRDNMIKFLH